MVNSLQETELWNSWGWKWLLEVITIRKKEHKDVDSEAVFYETEADTLAARMTSVVPFPCCLLLLLDYS